MLYVYYFRSWDAEWEGLKTLGKHGNTETHSISKNIKKALNICQLPYKFSTTKKSFMKVYFLISSLF